MGNCEKCLQVDCTKHSEKHCRSPRFSEIYSESQEETKSISLGFFLKKKRARDIQRGIYRNVQQDKDTGQNNERDNKGKQRTTYFERLGSLNHGINFVITTEKVNKFHCQFLIVFVDHINRLLDNPFIKEILKKNNVLTSKCHIIRQTTKFEGIGDYLLISDPFLGVKIPNLIVVWAPIFEGERQDFSCLKRSIQIGFQLVSTLPINLSIGIFELAYQYGFPFRDFQRLLFNQLIRFHHDLKKGLKFTYWAYDDQNANHFIQMIKTPQCDLSSINEQSSNYY